MVPVVTALVTPGLDKELEEAGFACDLRLSRKEAAVSQLQAYCADRGFPASLIMEAGFDSLDPKPAWELAVEIRTALPKLRVLYCCQSADGYGLAQCVKAGIADILVADPVTPQAVIDLLNHPASLEDAAVWLAYDQQQPVQQLSNAVAVWSVKPGSGKTFLAVNLAVAIARYGQDKRLQDGSLVKPRVAVIDGDLLTPTVTTVLRLNNEDRNIYTALNQVNRSVAANGHTVMTDQEQDTLKKRVRRCMTRHSELDNLYCLGGPKPDLETLRRTTAAHFTWLLEALTGAFDIMILDTNSSMDAASTTASLGAAAGILCCMDLDYNNIKNNIRYREVLLNRGYGDRMHTLINKDFSAGVQSGYIADLDYDTSLLQQNGIVVEQRIPLVPDARMRQLDYGGRVLIDDDHPDTEEARTAVLQVANELWKIDHRKMEKQDKRPESFWDRMTSRIAKRLNT